LDCNIGYGNGNVVNINLNIFEKGCGTIECNLPRKCYKQGQTFTEKCGRRREKYFPQNFREKDKRDKDVRE
jgi:hypothetical protein